MQAVSLGAPCGYVSGPSWNGAAYATPAGHKVLMDTLDQLQKTAWDTLDTSLYCDSAVALGLDTLAGVLLVS